MAYCLHATKQKLIGLYYLSTYCLAVSSASSSSVKVVYHLFSGFLIIVQGHSVLAVWHVRRVVHTGLKQDRMTIVSQDAFYSNQ